MAPPDRIAFVCPRLAGEGTVGGAETLLKNGDRESAIANYQKALTLNPESESAKRALAALGLETR